MTAGQGLLLLQVNYSLFPVKSICLRRYFKVTDGSDSYKMRFFAFFKKHIVSEWQLFHFLSQNLFYAIPLKFFFQSQNHNYHSP